MREFLDHVSGSIRSEVSQFGVKGGVAFRSSVSKEVSHSRKAVAELGGGVRSRVRQHMQCAMRREPTVSGQHTQPTRATQGRGQGMLRGSLGASVSSLSTNLQGAGWDSHLPAADGRGCRRGRRGPQGRHDA